MVKLKLYATIIGFLFTGYALNSAGFLIPIFRNAFLFGAAYVGSMIIYAVLVFGFEDFLEKHPGMNYVVIMLTLPFSLPQLIFLKSGAAGAVKDYVNSKDGIDFELWLKSKGIDVEGENL